MSTSTDSILNEPAAGTDMARLLYTGKRGRKAREYRCFFPGLAHKIRRGDAGQGAPTRAIAEGCCHVCDKASGKLGNDLRKLVGKLSLIFDHLLTHGTDWADYLACASALVSCFSVLRLRVGAEVD